MVMWFMITLLRNLHYSNVNRKIQFHYCFSFICKLFINLMIFSSIVFISPYNSVKLQINNSTSFLLETSSIFFYQIFLVLMKFHIMVSIFEALLKRHYYFVILCYVMFYLGRHLTQAFWKCFLWTNSVYTSQS